MAKQEEPQHDLRRTALLNNFHRRYTLSLWIANISSAFALDLRGFQEYTFPTEGDGSSCSISTRLGLKRENHHTGRRSIIAFSHSVRISAPARASVIQTPSSVPPIQKIHINIPLFTSINRCVIASKI